EMFGYVPGGYSVVVDAFRRKLEEHGVEIHTKTPVASIEQNRGGLLQVRTGTGETEAERVVITTTPGTVARMCPGLGADERAKFEGMKYQGVVCASLLLEKPLGGYYLSYLTDRGLPFTAVVEMSAFVDKKEFGGKSLVYLPKYAPASDPTFSWSDEEIRQRFEEGLRTVYPPFADNRVEAFRVSRVKEVFPLPRLGYSKHLPPMATSVPGVTAVSSAHIKNGTHNVNDTLIVAER